MSSSTVSLPLPRELVHYGTCAFGIQLLQPHLQLDVTAEDIQRVIDQSISGFQFVFSNETDAKVGTSGNIRCLSEFDHNRELFGYWGIYSHEQSNVDSAARSDIPTSNMEDSAKYGCRPSDDYINQVSGASPLVKDCLDLSDYFRHQNAERRM